MSNDLDVIVCHVNRPPSGRTLIYCGRRWAGHAASPLGNPFHKVDESGREASIAKFREWLWVKVKAEDHVVLDELARILGLAKEGPIALGCWCAPKACHCDIIKRALSWLAKKECV